MRTIKSLLRDKKAQAAAGGVLTAGVVIISLLLVGFIGVMILQSTSDATSLVEYNASAGTGDRLYEASANLVSVTGTVFSMYGVLVIVLIASVIIGLLLTSFMGGRTEE